MKNSDSQLHIFVTTIALALLITGLHELKHRSTSPIVVPPDRSKAPSDESMRAASHVGPEFDRRMTAIAAKVMANRASVPRAHGLRRRGGIGQ
jgi:hypothetical protein